MIIRYLAGLITHSDHRRIFLKKKKEHAPGPVSIEQMLLPSFRIPETQFLHFSFTYLMATTEQCVTSIKQTVLFPNYAIIYKFLLNWKSFVFQL